MKKIETKWIDLEKLLKMRHTFTNWITQDVRNGSTVVEWALWDCLSGCPRVKTNNDWFNWSENLVFASSTELDIEKSRTCNEKHTKWNATIYEFAAAGAWASEHCQWLCATVAQFALKKQSGSNVMQPDCVLWPLDFHLATNFIAEMDTGGFEVRTIKKNNTTSRINKQKTIEMEKRRREITSGAFKWKVGSQQVFVFGIVCIIYIIISSNSFEVECVNIDGSGSPRGAD